MYKQNITTLSTSAWTRREGFTISLLTWLCLCRQHPFTEDLTCSGFPPLPTQCFTDGVPRHPSILSITHFSFRPLVSSTPFFSSHLHIHPHILVSKHLSLTDKTHKRKEIKVIPSGESILQAMVVKGMCLADRLLDSSLAFLTSKDASCPSV